MKLAAALLIFASLSAKADIIMEPFAGAFACSSLDHRFGGQQGISFKEAGNSVNVVVKPKGAIKQNDIVEVRAVFEKSKCTKRMIENRLAVVRCNGDSSIEILRDNGETIRSPKMHGNILARLKTTVVTTASDFESDLVQKTKALQVDVYLLSADHLLDLEFDIKEYWGALCI